MFYFNTILEGAIHIYYRTPKTFIRHRERTYLNKFGNVVSVETVVDFFYLATVICNVILASLLKLRVVIFVKKLLNSKQ